MTEPLRLNRNQRDALYVSITSRLTGIDEVYAAIEAEDWVAAERLASEFADYLHVVQDLGWGEEGSETILTVAPDVVRRAMTRLQERAVVEGQEEAEERDELARLARRNQLLRETCSQVLGALDE
jgi:hypothetical protein